MYVFFFIYLFIYLFTYLFIYLSMGGILCDAVGAVVLIHYGLTANDFFTIEWCK